MAFSTSEGVLVAPAFTAPTGGTALSFTFFQNLAGTIKSWVTGDVDLRTRRYFLIKVKESKTNKTSPGGYTMQRNSLKFVVPTVNADGSISPNYVSLETGFGAECPIATRQLLVDLVGQSRYGAFHTLLRDGNQA